MKEKEEMLEELEEYYECAGFEDIYNRELKKLSEKEVEEMYKNTFSDKDL